MAGTVSVVFNLYGSSLPTLSDPLCAQHGRDPGGVYSCSLATANEVKRNCTRATECEEEAWSETASRWIDRVSAGEGEMSHGAQLIPIGPGDTLRIAPRTPHRVTAPASGPLILRCCCSPAYAHADTELL